MPLSSRVLPGFGSCPSKGGWSEPAPYIYTAGFQGVHKGERAAGMR